MKKLLPVLSITLLLAASCNKSTNTQNKLPSANNQTQQQVQTSTQTQPSSADSSGASNTDKSYTYGDVVLSYDFPQGDNQNVVVYISKNGVKTVLIKSVPIGVAGGTLPQFKRTFNPAIALLTTTDGDLGGYWSQSYYIDVPNSKVLSVRVTNGPYIEITNSNGIVNKIELSINDKCGEGEQRKEGMTATIDGLMLNNKLAFGLTGGRTIKCLNPGGIGPIYSPELKLTLTGVSKDLTKIFFTLKGLNYQNNNPEMLWQYNFIYYINNNSFVQGQASDIL